MTMSDVALRAAGAGVVSRTPPFHTMEHHFIDGCTVVGNGRRCQLRRIVALRHAIGLSESLFNAFERWNCESYQACRALAATDQADGSRAVGAASAERGLRADNGKGGM